MAALLVLIGTALALLALGTAARLAGGHRSTIQTALCLLGLATALLGQAPGLLEAGPIILTNDALSTTVLAAVFIMGACGAAGPAMLGVVVLALLAGDGIALVLLVGAATLLGPRGRLRPWAPAALAVAMLALAWHTTVPDVRFGLIRSLPPGTAVGAIALAATCAAAATLPFTLSPVPGLLLSFYAMARILLDLCGPTTPGWWGVPILLGATASAAIMARRAAAADDLAGATISAIRAIIALASAGIGVALLARGADLPPLGALAVAAGLLLVLATSLWGGLMLLATGAIQGTTGTSSIARLGGLLRRIPATGLALMVALASLAALPLSAGFAATWLLVQAVLASGRLGGTALLALSAGAIAAIGFTLALLAAAALRLAGTALLGAPRSAKAAAAAEPALRARLGMAALAVGSLAMGLLPGPALLILQPAIRQLAGVPVEGGSVWTIAASIDSPGYAAPAIALLLALCTAAAAWAGRGARLEAPVWRGGLAEDGPARGNTLPLHPWPEWRVWRPAVSPRLLLAALALVLAASIGWAAR